MARPSKSAKIISKNLTNTEKSQRIETEEKLKGSCDCLVPSEILTENQRKIFDFIVENLQNSGILSNLDTYVLSECSISIDRMQAIESRINENPELMQDSSLMSAKDKYTKAFFRYCNELCLSPQSRAKLANINTQQEENPLVKALNDDDGT